MLDPRKEEIVNLALRLSTTLVNGPHTGLPNWQAVCEQLYGELVKAAAEESYIVKAARLLTSDICDHRGDAQLRANADLLLAEVARAGAPPYEQGTGTNTETDWIEPLREELRNRNQ
jgi:hypothetical protein